MKESEYDTHNSIQDNTVTHRTEVNYSDFTVIELLDTKAKWKIHAIQEGYDPDDKPSLMFICER